MKTTRQLYETSTLADALAHGCDIVQSKYRGLWVRVEIQRGEGVVYDHRYQTLMSIDIPDASIACTLVGDLFGPPAHQVSRIVVWDCWRIGEESTERPMVDWQNIENFSYRDRWAFAKLNVGRMGIPFVLIKNYPIASAKDLWIKPDEPPLETCGLVFRKSTDPVEVILRVARRYKEAPADLL